MNTKQLNMDELADAMTGAAPDLPADLAGQPVRVLMLTSTASTGPHSSLLAAWSAGNGSHWSRSPLRLNGATPISASFRPGDAATVVLTGDHGETLAGPAPPWPALRALPPGTATLAPGPAAGLDLPSTAPG